LDIPKGIRLPSTPVILTEIKDLQYGFAMWRGQPLTTMKGPSDSCSFPDGWASHCRRPDRPAGQIAPVITLKRPQRMPPMLQMPQMPIIDLSGFKFAVAFFAVLFSSIPFDLRGTYARKFGRNYSGIPPLLSHYVMGVFFPPVTRDFIHQKSGGSSLCMVPIIFIFSCIFYALNCSFEHQLIMVPEGAWWPPPTPPRIAPGRSAPAVWRPCGPRCGARSACVEPFRHRRVQQLRHPNPRRRPGSRWRCE